MNMDVPASKQRSQRADLIALSEKDLGEIAQFIANQSRTTPGKRWKRNCNGSCLRIQRAEKMIRWVSD